MPSPVYKENNQTKTATDVPKAGGDNHISIEGSASTADAWKNSITSETFLKGPKPGQEQELIRSGDQSAKVDKGQSLSEVQKKSWLHVYDQDDVREFDQNRDITITKNESLTVIGDRTIKVAQNIDESAGQNIEITAGMTLTLKGPGGTIKIDPSGITIQGILVKINC